MNEVQFLMNDQWHVGQEDKQINSMGLNPQANYTN
jgi:hypothetical protein